jgi:hypothetical protein
MRGWTEEDNRFRALSLEDRLKETFFLVEADSYAVFTLWQDYALESPCHKKYAMLGPLDWQQFDGFWIQIGSIYKRPICLSFTFYRIGGKYVAFWEITSQLADYRMAEKWLAEHFTGRYDGGARRAETDASNFHHCLHAIEGR